MGSAGGSEEYLALRTEQIYRIQALHTLISAIIVGFFTSGVVILSWGFSASGLTKPEVLIWASPLLLFMVWTAAAVSFRWERMIWRMGRYLVVFHERPDSNGVPKNPDLGWLTRIARPGIRRSVIDRILMSEGVLGLLVLLLVLACAPIIYTMVVELRDPWPGSYWVALCLSVLEAAATVPLLVALRGPQKARQEFTILWETVRDDELRLRQGEPSNVLRIRVAPRRHTILG